MLEQKEDSEEQAPSSWALPPNSLLDRGRYRIVRLLGQGGMGAVYEAENTLTQKRVAIKRMHPTHATPAGTERLVREARAAARIRHRNAVDVYDVVQDDDTVFLVMELLQGEPLSAWLARGNQPVHRAIALLLPAMRAVGAAHRQGVIHRDIKPDNIFLAEEEGTPDVIPKVVDFGISKVQASDITQPTLTRTGGAIGTPRYMSYEQLAGEADIDGRADVYAFGVILYQILTGRLPYEAPSFPALVAKVVTSVPVDPKELCPEIPSVLARIVLWALARERDERIASMEELIRELEPFATLHGFRAEMTLPGDEVPTVPAEPPQHSELRRKRSVLPHTQPAEVIPSLRPTSVSRRRRGPWVLAFLIVAALGAWALKQLTSGPREASGPSHPPRVPAAPSSTETPAPLSDTLPSVPPSSPSLDVDAGPVVPAPSVVETQPAKPRPPVKTKRPVAGASPSPLPSKPREASKPPALPTNEAPPAEVAKQPPASDEAGRSPSGLRVRLPSSEQF